MKFLLHLLFLGINFCYGQSTSTTPCTAPEASQFDFWVGEWDLTWNDSLHGVNRVEKLFGNCAVHENFSNPKTGFIGQSWSVYNPGIKQWQQTWIDNGGGYISLTGEMKDDRMVLNTGETTTPNGKLRFRMVYYNITKNSFDWRWESTSDGGQSWKTNWLIHYKRRK